MAKRRAAGEGSLYEIKSGPSKGKWAAAVTISLPGEKQRRKVFTGETREHVRQLMKDAEYRGDVSRGAPKMSGTVGELVHDRLIERADRLKPRTIEQYRNIFRLHIDPYIGKRRAQDLTAEDVDRFFDRLAKDGRTPHIRRLVRAVLSGAYRWGMRRRRVSTNPLEMIEPQRIAKKRMNVWNESQAAKFLDVARGHRLYAFFVLALSVGMRLGELIALKWDDVDLRRGALSVQETAGEVKRGKPTMGDPKSAGSIRRILLPGLAIEALRAQREASMADHASQRSPYVFPDSDGGAMHARNVRERQFKPTIALTATEDPLPRHAPHVRVDRARGRHPVEGRERDTRTRVARIHCARISARDGDDAKRRRPDDGRRLTGSSAWRLGHRRGLLRF